MQEALEKERFLQDLERAWFANPENMDFFLRFLKRLEDEERI